MLAILAAIFSAVTTAFSVVWSIIAPIKWYVLTAIVAIAAWQYSGAASWFTPSNAPWCVSAQAQQVAPDCTITAKIPGWLLKRNIILTGVNIPDKEAAQAYMTKLMSTNAIILGVTDGRRFLANAADKPEAAPELGALTAIVYTSDGVCVNLALICKGLATCADNKYPEWVKAEQIYGGK